MKITQSEFAIWMKCLTMAMDQLNHPRNFKDYLIEIIGEVEYDVCPMDNFKERLIEVFRSEIEKSAYHKFDFGHIDESMRLELLKYVDSE